MCQSELVKSKFAYIFIKNYNSEIKKIITQNNFILIDKVKLLYYSEGVIALLGDV